MDNVITKNRVAVATLMTILNALRTSGNVLGVFVQTCVPKPSAQQTNPVTISTELVNRT